MYRIRTHHGGVQLDVSPSSVQRRFNPARRGRTKGGGSRYRIRRHGHYRGESIRSLAEGCAEPRDVFSLLRAWDTAELPLASRGEILEPNGDAGHVTLRLSRIPGSDYFEDKSSAPVLELYWSELLTGLVVGYDEALSITYESLTERGSSPWSIDFLFQEPSPASRQLHREMFLVTPSRPF